MKHSLKHIWITIFSILAMLMSNYVSSAPAMVMSNMQGTIEASYEQSIPHEKTSHNQNYTHTETHSSNYHVTQEQSDCHSMDDGISAVDSGDQTSSKMSHCDANSGVDNCCASVCSSASHPTESLHGIQVFSFSLALHQPFKVGHKVARIQSLLRPPSA